MDSSSLNMVGFRKIEVLLASAGVGRLAQINTTPPPSGAHKSAPIPVAPWREAVARPSQHTAVVRTKTTPRAAACCCEFSEVQRRRTRRRRDA